MRKHLKMIVCAASVILLAYLVLFLVSHGQKASPKNTNPIDLSVLQTNPINHQTLTDRREIYETETGITDIYVTVYPGTSTFGNPYTLADLNVTTRFDLGIDEPQVYANVKVGSPNGVEGQVGYNRSEVNATMKLRGHSTRRAAQKSFKLKLYDDAGLFNGQDTINLNKHPYDFSRFTNKLSFDLFKDIPDFTSSRTNFVRLYVKDQTGEQIQEEYQDYGLFTHVEELDKKYMRAHGLDPNGNLYKVENFEFYRYPDEIKSQLDDDYDEEKFEERLSIIAGSDHRKIIQVLDALNDPNADINSILDTYFDRNNYYTWLAVNLLLGNLDTTSQNFLLYSPTNSMKWYFLPWDYDGSLQTTQLVRTSASTMPASLRGICRYMSVSLHKRVMSYPQNRQELLEKVDEVYRYFSPEKVSNLVNLYRPLVEPIAFSEPDAAYINTTREAYDLYTSSFNDIIADNDRVFKETLAYPTPIFMLPCTQENDELKLEWSPSFDLAGTNLHYSLELATDIEMKDIVYSNMLISSTEHRIDLVQTPLQGTYYMRVYVYNEMDNVQRAYNMISNEITFERYYGVQKITVQE